MSCIEVSYGSSGQDQPPYGGNSFQLPWSHSFSDYPKGTVGEWWDVNRLVHWEFHPLAQGKEVSIICFHAIWVGSSTFWWYVAPYCLECEIWSASLFGLASNNLLQKPAAGFVMEASTEAKLPQMQFFSSILQVYDSVLLSDNGPIFVTVATPTCWLTCGWWHQKKIQPM